MDMAELASTAPPKVSVLVAAWNEKHNLGPFVRSFQGLAYPNKELVLCAGGDDGTYAQALALAGATMKVVPQTAGEGKQAALRRAFASSEGEIILLTDADGLLSDDAFNRIIGPLVTGAEHVTTGVSRPKQASLADPFVLYQFALEQHGHRRLRRRRYLASTFGRNCAVRRDLLVQIGAFDQHVPVGTDAYLAKKIIARGCRIRFVPDSAVESDYPASFGSYLRQRARWRRGAILHNLTFSRYDRALQALIPPGLALVMFVMPLAGLWLGQFILYLWAALFSYSYLRRVRSLRELAVSQQLPIATRTYYKAALYLWVEWSAQLLALYQLPQPRLRRAW
jgi:cellulose synthase/poly-beta-1,6-N-acetylglucosamine synthase-like glycosyltransferase